MSNLLDEAVLQIEQRFPAQMGQLAFCCETGDRYVTIDSNGIKQEGEASAVWYESEDQAIGAWLDAVTAYASDKVGTLYWRMRPTLEAWPLDDKARTHDRPAYKVFSRLVISDKPLLPEGHNNLIEIQAEEAKGDRIRRLAMRLCSNLGLDPDAEVSRNVPQYLGIDVCYPAAYYVPPSTCSLWELFSLQAEMMIEIIDEEKSANE
jgi:hypothetical protein